LTRLIGNGVPDDPAERELFCLAAANPGNFYGRDLDGNQISGGEITISAQKDANEDCGGSGDSETPGAMFTGYYCPTSPSAINFSMSGSAPLPLESRGGVIANASYFAGEDHGTQQVQPGEGDCCDTTSDFGADFTSRVYPKCCPIAITASVALGGPCDEETNKGFPSSSVTVTISVVPEAP
jgi:hypothetical protein